MKIFEYKKVFYKMSIIAIEGNIAAGKSTLVQKLKEIYAGDARISFLDEPVEEWENTKDKYGISMLQKYYSDTKKYSFAFQMMALGSRLNILKKKINSLDPTIPHVIITERSVYTDRDVFAKMLYDQHMMEDVEYNIYNKWFTDFVDNKVDKIVMLKTDPIVSFERVGIRGRAGEVIPIEYLQTCHEYHVQMLDNLDIPKYVFNANSDIYENPEILNKWLESFDQIIKESLQI